MLNTKASDTWYYLKGDQPQGPFTYEKMIGFTQSGEVKTSDYVWTAELESWLPLGFCAEFSYDRIQNLYHAGIYRHLFASRLSERVTSATDLIIHDQKKMWQGKTLSISKQGALLQMDESGLAAGQKIVLHFPQSKSVKQTFNCVAEVVEKRMLTKRSRKDQRTHYVIRFDKSFYKKIEEVFLQAGGGQ